MKPLTWKPQTLREFIGQTDLVAEMTVEVSAAKAMMRPLNHAIFAGPGGLGKTTLAEILARERGAPCIKAEDLTHDGITGALLDIQSRGYNSEGFLVDPSVAEFPIILLDECESIDKEVLELLHTVLEPVGKGNRLGFVGKHPETGEVRPIWVKHCTLVFVTNHLGELVGKNRATFTRIPLQKTFSWYSVEEIAQTLRVFCRQTDLQAEDEAILAVARRANGVPRIAISLLKRTLDYAVVAGSSTITAPIAEHAFSTMGIGADGLDKSMVAYLQALSQATGKIGLQGLSAMLCEEEETLTGTIEPILMRRGLILRSSGGRSITPAGRAALNRSGNESDRFFAQSMPA